MAVTVDGRHYPAVGEEALGPDAGKFSSILLDQAAVAAATIGDVAVIGPNGEQIPIVMTNA